jgi:hypothetical protein
MMTEIRRIGGDHNMNKKRIRLSPVEFALILFLVVSLLLNFLEARRQETLRAQRSQTRGA